MSHTLTVHFFFFFFFFSSMVLSPSFFLFFFFNDTATPEIYTLPLHDALPILPLGYCLTSSLPINFPATVYEDNAFFVRIVFEVHLLKSIQSDTVKEPPRRLLRVVLFFLAIGGSVVLITGLTALLIYNSAKPSRHERKAVAPGVKVATWVSLQSESSYPYGLAPAPDGSLYLTIFGNGLIFKVDKQGQLTRLNVTSGALRAPGAAAVGADGSLYVIDYTAPGLESVGRIKQVTPDGQVSSSGVTPHGSDLSLFAQMTFDTAGNLYVTSPSTADVSQIAPGRTSRVWWAVPPLNNSAAQPTGIAYDASRQAMIVGDAGTGTIYRVALTADGKAGGSLA